MRRQDNDLLRSTLRSTNDPLLAVGIGLVAGFLLALFI